MKGVVITGGKVPAPGVMKLIASGCSICVVADSGLDSAIAAGIEPDFAVGDMDSLSDPSLLDRLPPGRVSLADRDKDNTDTELALTLLKGKGCDERILIGGSGGRLDHLLAVRALFDREDPPAVWVGDESIAIGIGAGFPRSGVKLDGLAVDSAISVFPCGAAPHVARGKSLYWPVDGLEWDRGAFSLSNRRFGTGCAVEAVCGSFLVILPLDSIGDFGVLT